MREAKRLLDESDEASAFGFFQEELKTVRSGTTVAAVARLRFDAYATSLLERKILVGEIKSVTTREMWGYVLEHDLFSVFGDFCVDAIRRADIETWKGNVGKRIRAEDVSPNTANGGSPSPDVLWDAGVILVRRSQTAGRR